MAVAGAFFRSAGEKAIKTDRFMVEFFSSIFEGTGAWSGGIAHSIIILALVIALGKVLGKIKVAGISPILLFSLAMLFTRYL